MITTLRLALISFCRILSGFTEPGEIAQSLTFPSNETSICNDTFVATEEFVS